MRWLWIAVYFACVACGSDAKPDRASDSGGTGGTGGTGGSAGAPPDIELIPAQFTQEREPMTLLVAGDNVDLERAVQGGHVMYVGAQIRNLEADFVELRARLRHPDTRAIQAEEAREIVLRPVEGEPDLLQPDIRSLSQVAHIPACPNYDDRSIRDQTWLMELIVTTLDGNRSGSTELEIVPACRQDDEVALGLCECECDPEYVLGKCGDL